MSLDCIVGHGKSQEILEVPLSSKAMHCSGMGRMRVTVDSFGRPILCLGPHDPALFCQSEVHGLRSEEG